MSRWNWVWRDAEKSERLFQVGILPDGALRNPNGYPDGVVRAAIAAVEARRSERRSNAAKQAAETRAKRQQNRIGYIAQRVAAAQKTGLRSRCYVCGRRLTDPESINRGIGSECWQDVLTQISEITRAGEASR
jgi:Family of unknown function (DUF6011)